MIRFQLPARWDTPETIALTPARPSMSDANVFPRPDSRSKGMLRRFIFLIFVLLIVFSAAIFSITTQPTDFTHLRTLLFDPDHCEQPCVLGIHPGETQGDQAVALLRAHTWIQSVKLSSEQPPQTVTWEWSGAQPDVLTAGTDANMPFMRIDREGVVQWIYLPTRIPYGEVWQWFGAPEKARTELDGRASVFTPVPVEATTSPRDQFSAFLHPNAGMINRTVNYVAAYFGGRIEVDTTMTCPLAVRDFWAAPAVINIYGAGYVRPDLDTFVEPLWQDTRPC